MVDAARVIRGEVGLVCVRDPLDFFLSFFFHSYIYTHTRHQPYYLRSVKCFLVCCQSTNYFRNIDINNNDKTNNNVFQHFFFSEMFFSSSSCM